MKMDEYIETDPDVLAFRRVLIDLYNKHGENKFIEIIEYNELHIPLYARFFQWLGKQK